MVIYDNDNLFKFNYIYCNEDSLNFIKNFPKINFILKSYNFNFEFSGIELFQKINEFYYFQIIYPVEDNEGSKKISLGAQFFIKYQMSFNIDAKTIIFYKKTVNKTNKNNNIFIILIIILIIFIIFSIGFIYYLKNFRNRRKRKNELIEYIEYENFPENKLGV